MCGQCLHKKYDAHSPTRSVMCAPQDPPVSNGNQSSNQLLSPFEFRAEEKKQDDDTMDLEIGYSSSAAYPQDNRSLHFDGSARRPPYVIHHRVRESPGSGIMRDENCTGDCQNDGALSEDNSAPFGLKAVPSNHIVLSLNDEYYKEIMWRHYRILGKTRDSGRELRIGNDVFAIFQQKMGQTGRFFKRAQNQDFEVNDEIALASEFDLVTPFPSHTMIRSSCFLIVYDLLISCYLFYKISILRNYCRYSTQDEKLHEMVWFAADTCIQATES